MSLARSAAQLIGLAAMLVPLGALSLARAARDDGIGMLVFGAAAYWYWKETRGGGS